MSILVGMIAFLLPQVGLTFLLIAFGADMIIDGLFSFLEEKVARMLPGEV